MEPECRVGEWSTPPSTHAVTVVKTTGGSVYTGLTSALIDGRRYFYTANASKEHVDVTTTHFIV
jgi:hypothetical protein